MYGAMTFHHTIHFCNWSAMSQNDIYLIYWSLHCLCEKIFEKWNLREDWFPLMFSDVSAHILLMSLLAGLWWRWTWWQGGGMVEKSFHLMRTRKQCGRRQEDSTRTLWETQQSMNLYKISKQEMLLNHFCFELLLGFLPLLGLRKEG